jgi:hypothetical protein
LTNPHFLEGDKVLVCRTAVFAEGDKFLPAKVAVFPEGDKFSSKATGFGCGVRRSVAMPTAQSASGFSPAGS